MNGIDVLEQDGFREIRGANPSSPHAVGVMTNQTGFDVEGSRTIDILAKAPGIKLVAVPTTWLNVSVCYPFAARSIVFGNFLI